MTENIKIDDISTNVEVKTGKMSNFFKLDFKSELKVVASSSIPVVNRHIPNLIFINII